MLRLARPGHCDYAVVSNRLCFTPSAFADVSGKVYWLGLCQVPSLGVQRQKAEGPPDLASILGGRRDSIETPNFLCGRHLAAGWPMDKLKPNLENVHRDLWNLLRYLLLCNTGYNLTIS